MCHSLDGVDDYTFTAYGFYEGNWDFDSDYDLDSTWEEVPEEDFKKMLMDKALKEYPKGTKVKSLAYWDEAEFVTGEPRFGVILEYSIWVKTGYSDAKLFDPKTGKWAEVVEPKEKSAFERVGESITPEIKAEIERQVKQGIEKLNKDTYKRRGIKNLGFLSEFEVEELINELRNYKWREVEKGAE